MALKYGLRHVGHMVAMYPRGVLHLGLLHQHQARCNTFGPTQPATSNVEVCHSAYASRGIMHYGGGGQTNFCLGVPFPAISKGEGCWYVMGNKATSPFFFLGTIPHDLVTAEGAEGVMWLSLIPKTQQT